MAKRRGQPVIFENLTRVGNGDREILPENLDQKYLPTSPSPGVTEQPSPEEISEPSSSVAQPKTIERQEVEVMGKVFEVETGRAIRKETNPSPSSLILDHFSGRATVSLKNLTRNGNGVALVKYEEGDEVNYLLVTGVMAFNQKYRMLKIIDTMGSSCKNLNGIKILVDHVVLFAKNGIIPFVKLPVKYEGLLPRVRKLIRIVGTALTNSTPPKTQEKPKIRPQTSEYKPVAIDKKKELACGCGMIVSLGSFQEHKKTEKHLEWMKTTLNMHNA